MPHIICPRLDGSKLASVSVISTLVALPLSSSLYVGVFPFVFIVLFLLQFAIVVAVVAASLLLCLRNEFNLQLYLFFMLVWADSITAQATIPNSKFIEIECFKMCPNNKSSCMVTLICTMHCAQLSSSKHREGERETYTQLYFALSHAK